LLAAYPMMPATVLAEQIGWPYSIRTLSGRVSQLSARWLLPVHSPILPSLGSWQIDQWLALTAAAQAREQRQFAKEQLNMAA
jgi:hypothetical protein